MSPPLPGLPDANTGLCVVILIPSVHSPSIQLLTHPPTCPDMPTHPSTQIFLEQPVLPLGSPSRWVEILIIIQTSLRVVRMSAVHP